MKNKIINFFIYFIRKIWKLVLLKLIKILVFNLFIYLDINLKNLLYSWIDTGDPYNIVFCAFSFLLGYLVFNVLLNRDKYIKEPTIPKIDFTDDRKVQRFSTILKKIKEESQDGIL